MEPCLALGVAGAFFALVFAAAHAVHKQRLKDLRGLADFLEGTVFRMPSWGSSLNNTAVRGSYDHHRVEVRYEVRGSGKHKSTWVHVEVGVNEPIVGFRIRPAGILNRFGRWLGVVADTKTGNARVDDKYIIDGRADALEGVFAHSEAERHLDALFRGSRASELKLRGGMLTTSFRVGGVSRAQVAGVILNLVPLAKLCDRKPIEIRIKGGSPATTRFAWTGGTDQAMCPYCRDQIEPEGQLELSACSSCNTVHHSECMQEAGGCTVFGCGGGRRARQRVR